MSIDGVHCLLTATPLPPPPPPLSPAEKVIDLSTVDLKTLRVKELKKILSNWGEDCLGCAEKSDFIDKINMLKPVYHSEL